MLGLGHLEAPKEGRVGTSGEHRRESPRTRQRDRKEPVSEDSCQGARRCAWGIDLPWKVLVGWVRGSGNEEEGRRLTSHLRWWEWLSLGKLLVTQGHVTQRALTSICPLCSATSIPTGS